MLLSTIYHLYIFVVFPLDLRVTFSAIKVSLQMFRYEKTTLIRQSFLNELQQLRHLPAMVTKFISLSLAFYMLNWSAT